MIENVPSVHGYPCQRIQNGIIQVDFLSTVGPRIVGLRLSPSGDNLLADLPDTAISTPLGSYVMHGGHRLWHSPEANPRSYIPDDRGLTVRELPDGVRLTEPVETETGIEKNLEIHLSPDRPELAIHHYLINHGLWPVELAAWAITQMPPGGIVIIPEPDQPTDPTGLLPNRRLVLWPYTRWLDPRLRLDDGLIVIDAIPMLPPLKIGILSAHGWIGYLQKGNLFIKQIDPQVKLPHPDFGCNIESYCKDTFIEIETLSPLVRLEPGQSVEHIEHWKIISSIDAHLTSEEIRSLVNSLTV